MRWAERKTAKAKRGRNVTQKAGLNRGIAKAGWGLLVRRLEDKAPGRVQKVPRGGDGTARPMNREPQPALPA